LEGIAPSLRLTLSVHVGVRTPRRSHATKRYCDGGELTDVGNLPAFTRLHTATAAVCPAIRFDSILQPLVRRCAHVAVRSTTVYHGSTPTPRERLPIDAHLRQANVVETGVPLHRHPLDRPGVVRRIVAADDYNATPICKAERESGGLYVLVVREELVQQCVAARAGTDPKNTVGPLSVEEIVLILMATH